ncbi:transmembrane protein (macronuclear) [Tetrahymena thermophila SB210]|uniref:Transmembrane protein n=1 Tax=Tetrahymena thermophila (strain SB210) TaxID=312017 RepID=I7M6A4_TETTS|nr:transmembrane protein [Tetrahymena thermophila SB210]EAR84845.2 transmembrane protein [Tetrahymena thermophila SB210]|eukprot:XP_001032508.2 transmembrane protein [Tetrahymena thermophila SB210]
MRGNYILFILFFVGFALVSSKQNKSQIELQSLDSSETLKKQIQHSSSHEKSLKHSSSYSKERFSSRKKFHQTETNPSLAQTTIAASHKTKRIEQRGDSVLGDMVIGALLFFAGFPCLWFNEKGYAYTKTFLRKYLKQCIKVEPTMVDSQNEGKLVCVNGDTTTFDVIQDPAFNIQVQNCIKLYRKCEMYQWVQDRHTRRINNSEDEVYYTYTLSWKDSFIESRTFVEEFGHENNNNDWLYNEQEMYAPTVNYGAFYLTEIQKKKCSKYEPVNVDLPILQELAAKGNYQLSSNPIVQQSASQNQSNVSPVNPMTDGYPNQQGYYPAPSQNNNSWGQKTILFQDGYIYFKKNVNTTATAGDFRVKFTKIPCGEITVIGQQAQGCIETFSPEESKQKKDLNDDEALQDGNGCCFCCSAICKVCEIINAPISEINWVKEQKVKKKVIFQEQLSSYELKTWLMRFLGFLCFMLGVYFMLSPVYTLLYWFPLVGRFLGALGSFICGLVGFLIAVPLTILVISIAWLFYRKEIGIPLLCVALIIIGYFTYAYAKDYKGEQSKF